MIGYRLRVVLLGTVLVATPLLLVAAILLWVPAEEVGARLESVPCAAREFRRRRSGRVFVFVDESVASAGSKHCDGRGWSLGRGAGGCRRPLFE